MPEFKAWAELVAVPESFVYKIPANMTFTEAAAITLNYLVAHILVNDLAVVRPGNSVLLHSAGGGVVSLLVISFLYHHQSIDNFRSMLFHSAFQSTKNFFDTKKTLDSEHGEKFELLFEFRFIL